MASPQTCVYFDGLCVVCSTEIRHYQKMAGSENIDFIDITASDFDPIQHGLDPHEIHKALHVKDAAGNLHLGVDAFIQIWEQIPRYAFLAKWARNQWIRRGLNLGYSVFTRIRPYLPRRKESCSASPYCAKS